ncbi:MAG: hypothetical protein JXB60_07985 [Candidatus Cloacimonetes bacterium]|nr:hypothetical protein [Candidatus Cloacimonadota bacterium]
MKAAHFIVPLYLMMLACHVAHVFEEIWGGFWLMRTFPGLRCFLLVNWLLFCIPVLLLYFVLQGKRIAFLGSIIYTVIMVLNGVVHNVAFHLTGRYGNGFAGNYTGIGLIVIGIPLIYALWSKNAR